MNEDYAEGFLILRICILSVFFNLNCKKE